MHDAARDETACYAWPAQLLLSTSTRCVVQDPARPHACSSPWLSCYLVSPDAAPVRWMPFKSLPLPGLGQPDPGASDDFVVLWLPGECLYYHAGLQVAMLHMMLEGSGAASLASMPLHGILR